uniref:Cadherin domain-containing protein n=1 Tax=Stegastes partitus TaxID=144197 RepID=A0A3B5ABD7_9TELE
LTSRVLSRRTMRRQVLLFISVLFVSPVLGQVSYSINEEMSVGSVVGRIAEDLGLDVERLKSRKARVFFGDSREYIELNKDRGVLLIKERIDRETFCGQTVPCAMHFQIILEKPVEFYRIIVEIVDINDNPPVFEKGDIRFKISESAVTGSKFDLEGAVDLDFCSLNSLGRCCLRCCCCSIFTAVPPLHFDVLQRKGRRRSHCLRLWGRYTRLGRTTIVLFLPICGLFFLNLQFGCLFVVQEDF